MEKLESLSLPALHLLAGIVVFPKKEQFNFSDRKRGQQMRVLAAITRFLFHFAHGALERRFAPFKVTPGENPEPGIGDGRNVVPMLEKRRAIVTQQDHSHHLANVICRREDHKRTGTFNPAVALSIAENSRRDLRRGASEQKRERL